MEKEKPPSIAHVEQYLRAFFIAGDKADERFAYFKILSFRGFLFRIVGFFLGVIVLGVVTIFQI